MPVCHAGASGKLACTAAFLICGAFFESVLTASGDGNRNVYDIRIPCSFEPLCYDFSALDKYLALSSVRESLGVGDRKYEQCSSDVYQAMLMDFMRNIEPLVPPLLEDGIRTLVYVGENDFICNWLGNSRWLAAMPWSGQEGYVSAEWTPFEVGNKTHGIATGYGPLTFLKVSEGRVMEWRLACGFAKSSAVRLLCIAVHVNVGLKLLFSFRYHLF